MLVYLITFVQSNGLSTTDTKDAVSGKPNTRSDQKEKEKKPLMQCKRKTKLKAIKSSTMKFGRIRLFTSISSLHDAINHRRGGHVERSQRFGRRPMLPINMNDANCPRIDCTCRNRSDWK